jgi:hypothetical protein
MAGFISHFCRHFHRSEPLPFGVSRFFGRFGLFLDLAGPSFWVFLPGVDTFWCSVYRLDILAAIRRCPPVPHFLWQPFWLWLLLQPYFYLEIAVNIVHRLAVLCVQP